MIFIDTWAWYALGNAKEPTHPQSRRVYTQAQQEHLLVCTTDYVLDELITLLFRRLPFQEAQPFVEGLVDSVGRGFIRLVPITPERFEKAWQLRVKYRDHPKISFTDFTSFVVMQELGIRQVLTDDEHFLKVNMGFQIAR